MDRNEPFSSSEDFNPTLAKIIREWAKKTIRDQLKNMLGKPGMLVRLIEDGVIVPFIPVEHTRSIWHHSAVYWEQWNRNFELEALPIDYWMVNKSECRLSKGSLRIEALENFIRYEVVNKYTLDIKDIKGISGSKSSEFFFDTIKDFALERSKKFISNAQEDDFYRNIRWGEIKLHNMFFRMMNWSSHSPFWMNTGGSHHFAAAHHIATSKGLEYQLEGKLKKYSIDSQAASELVDNWSMFIMDDVSINTGFMNSMSLYKCSFGVCNLPVNLFKNTVYSVDEGCINRKVRIVFLNKGEAKANKVAKLLSSAGFVKFNKYIERYVNK